MEVFIDIETFSRTPIKQGVHKYSEGGCEILILAWAVDNEPVQTWAPPLEFEAPEDLIDCLTRATKIVAHNRNFERVILRELGPDHGFPDIPLEKWDCTMAKARILALPAGLDALAKVLGCSPKESSGKKFISRFCSPVRPTKAHPTDRWLPHEDPEGFQEGILYCAQDVVTTREVYRIIGGVPPVNRETFVLDAEINDRGFPFDVTAAKKALRILGDCQEALVEEFQGLSGGLSPTQTGEVTIKLRKLCGIPNMQAGTIEAFLKSDKLHPHVRRMLEIRASMAMASTKKLSPAVESAIDGRVKDSLIYHGATTGRFKGAGVQPHNFVKSTGDYEEAFHLISLGSTEVMQLIYDDPMEAISRAMRMFIRAPEGYDMYSGDYSSIEARTVLWLAGQEDALEMYRDKVDLYCEMAGTIFGIPAKRLQREYESGCPEAKKKRALGKAAVLGCGYAMGANKFQITCAKPPANMQVPDDLAKKAVNSYRSRFNRVPLLWDDLYQGLMKVIASRRPLHMAGGRLLASMKRYGKMEVLHVELPSSRMLAYPFPEIRPCETPWGKPQMGPTFMETNAKFQWTRGDTHGGKIAENVVSAMSCDLMSLSLPRLEEAGFETFLTVHDSVHALRPKDEGSSEHLKEFLRLMTLLPEWAEGLPIDAEGHVGEFFCETRL